MRRIQVIVAIGFLLGFAAGGPVAALLAAAAGLVVAGVSLLLSPTLR